MKLYVIFAQRKEFYPGEHAVEALAVMDEYVYDENPEWLEDKLDEHRKNDDFVAAEIVEIQLPSRADTEIRQRLVGRLRVDGSLTESGRGAGS